MQSAEIGPATFRASAGWRDAYSEPTPVSRVGFEGGAPFTVTGAPLSRDAAVIEADVGVQVSRKGRLGASYTSQFGDRGHDHGFTCASLKA